MAGGRAVKFVGHDAAGLPVKRKQVNQACLGCRKRKKDQEDHETSSVEEERSAGARERSERTLPDHDTSDAAAQLLRFFHHASDKTPASSPDDGQRRRMSPAPPFLGDLNPEGILVEATMAAAATPRTSRTDEQPDHQVLGFLPPASPRQSRAAPAQERRIPGTDSPEVAEETPGPFFSIPRGDGTSFTIHVQDTAKFAALAQTLVNSGLADKVMPSDTEWRAMRDMYLGKIHPIFPIFDRSTLVGLPEETGLRELVQACVCLAAATDPEARSFLTFKSPLERVAEPQTTVSYDEYSREMANFINRRLVELQGGQRIPLTYQVQVMALTCLYWQPASPTERFEPLSLYAKLVSLVHTHGVHLGLLARAQADGDREGSANRLFSCLYALDRLLGTIAARPVMFHNVDLIQIPRPDTNDSPIFRLFMSLILLLDQVIEMYRPRPKLSYIDMPVFESMAIDAGAQCEPESLLATLEVLYHAIGVLSVRMPRHRFRTAPECDTLACPRTQHLPPSSVNARRSHSSDRILDVIKDYKLSPLPFIPYAITLSLSVAYRKWRFSRLPMFRTRGGADFKKVLPVVQDLGAIWSSARINGQLGQAVMLKLDRNGILTRKRKRRTTEAARARQGRTGVLGEEEDNREASADGRNRAEGENDTQSATTNPAQRTITPPDAPASPRMPLESVRVNQQSGADTNTLLGPPPGLRGCLPSPATSITERPQPQPLPLTWTAGWTADSNSNNSSSNSLSNNLPWPAPPKDTASQPNPTQQPDIPQGYDHCQSDDAIPLPGDLLSQPSGFDDTSPLAGLSESNLDDFLVDDDALFRSWDPRFAQSVDFSFSSILDPGNPFAWPEYCHYTS
ncbi:hypothetical protein C8A00DRAFT_19416 [Chaetomidium leptoderma]|uniref:Transcription factor domain-containing protein n=1 Tax=Chaetomidium leptoderma TaxID=669021 RepID=A0AAN6VCC3_9PEZI|nr:hypothetical protein C8A00DRAFT_19416 [Chaetomidium leptoderma]